LISSHTLVSVRYLLYSLYSGCPFRKAVMLCWLTHAVAVGDRLQAKRSTAAAATATRCAPTMAELATDASMPQPRVQLASGSAAVTH
jgi:hypothetical protein